VWNEASKKVETLSLIFPILIELVDEEGQRTNVDWSLENFDKDFTKIQLAFEDADSISI